MVQTLLFSEMAFTDLRGVMSNAERYVKHTVKYAVERCSEDIDFFNKFFDKGLRTKLTKLVDEPFVKITYKDAIALLQGEIKNDPSKWQYPNVEFGSDLASEHERWLAESHFQSCVFVHNYPRGQSLQNEK